MKSGGIVILVVSAALASPSFAQKPADPKVLADCDRVTDLAISLAQSGQRKEAHRLVPTLERCNALQKIELHRRVGKAIETMTEAVPGTEGSPAGLKRRGSIPR